MSSTIETLSIAKRFLLIRTSHGISQKEFADALGISLRAEQNYERGERALPSEVLLALAKVYDVDPLWILEGLEDKPRKLNPNTINTQLLARAINIVLTAINDSGRNDLTTDQISLWVTAVYRFYSENASGTGADDLVKNLIKRSA